MTPWTWILNYLQSTFPQHFVHVFLKLLSLHRPRAKEGNSAGSPGHRCEVVERNETARMMDFPRPILHPEGLPSMPIHLLPVSKRTQGCLKISSPSPIYWKSRPFLPEADKKGWLLSKYFPKEALGPEPRGGTFDLLKDCDGLLSKDTTLQTVSSCKVQLDFSCSLGDEVRWKQLKSTKIEAFLTSTSASYVRLGFTLANTASRHFKMVLVHITEAIQTIFICI